MGWLPWSTSDDAPDAGPEPTFEGAPAADPVVACSFQDGTVFVYEDGLYIDRPPRSTFQEKWILTDQISDVVLDSKLTVHYLQIRQQEASHDVGGLFSTPVDENTVHFGRGKRDCAKRAKTAIRDQIDDVVGW